jgi:hypothetical protein
MEEEIRVELTDLQKFFDTGKLDADTLKKRAVALRTGVNHIYIKKVDFEKIQYKYFHPEKKLTSSDFLEFDPEPENLPSEIDWSKYVLGIAGIVFVVIVYNFIALKFHQTERTSLSYKALANGKTINNFSDSSHISKGNSAGSKGLFPKLDTVNTENTNSLSSRQLSLEESIESELSNYDVRLLHLFTENKLCLWVYVVDEGQNMNDIASVLCPTAKKYDFKCVSIFDSSYKRLGRSLCD